MLVTGGFGLTIDGESLGPLSGVFDQVMDNTGGSSDVMEVHDSYFAYGFYDVMVFRNK